MKIQTFSVVVGTPACDGNCPFCISHMTGFENLEATPDINHRNFAKACSLARMGQCTTVLITGKGEPTLYPEEISEYLECLAMDKMGSPFPFLELQTNGIQIGNLARIGKVGRHRSLLYLVPHFVPKYQQLTDEHLQHWHEMGLNTIALSVVGINPEHNKRIYKDDYPPLEETVAYLHELGYSVRLCVMMQRGMVDSIDKILEVASWCKKHKVAQLTVRPIRAPKFTPLTTPTSEETYVNDYGIHLHQETKIRAEIDDKATHILTLMHGAHAAKVYDVDGQNLCLADCLTMEPQSDDIRTLIFYSDGKLSYAWQYDGARLL